MVAQGPTMYTQATPRLVENQNEMKMYYESQISGLASKQKKY